MATFDLGRVTPIYKGDYSASASYELNDVVLYDGNLYWHHKPTATVGVLPTDTTVWGVVFTDEGVRAEIRGYADNAQASANSASASKTAAAQSASQASASASQAALSAQTAQTAESGATASAQTASTKASEATASAQAAASSAQTATDKATLASQKASEASASASTASEAKTAAITNAQLSVTKADEARNSATAAANSATSAQTSASAASASETAAANSATAAATSEANAQRCAEDSAAYLNSFPTDTAEGAIASFTDGADNVPVKSLVVDIEPVQDLHGYDAPWPAGCGVNLLPPYSKPSVTNNGVTLTNNNGEYTLNGTASSGIAVFDLRANFPAGQYTVALNNPTANSNVQIYGVDENNAVPMQVACSTANSATTATFESTVAIFRIRVLRGGTVDNFKLSPVFSAGATAATKFYPYSNICPITGWTGAKVSKSGVNLWDEEWVVGTVSSVGVPYYIDGKIRSKNYIPVKQGATLYFKGPSEMRVAQYDASKTFISYTTVTNGTLTMTDKTCFVMFAMDKADETYDGDISINYPATDTAYHPYSGESVDISFPTEAGTVYGGTLDVTTGKLTVTKGFIQSYNGEALPGVWISDMDVYAQGATPTTGAEVCYNLTTPITYQLTPTEVKSLLGQNNIWADTGDTTAEYRADTSAYIAKKIAEAISALS